MIVKNLPYIFLFLFSFLLAFGISGIYPFIHALAVIFPIVSILGYFLYRKKKEESELILPYLKLIEEQENALLERTTVISEYEKILDSQYTIIECDCKNGLFEGFFENNSDNLVTCDKCGNNYKININYSAIQVSQPKNADEIYEELSEQIEN